METQMISRKRIEGKVDKPDTVRANRSGLKKLFIGLLAATTFACIAGTATAAIQFSDATSGANISKSSETYGASVGDLNGDFYPDIFLSNHRAKPSLYLNLGNGKFIDVAPQTFWWNNKPLADQHGASWADFDNDGDMDLLVSTGTGNSTQMLVNQRGALVYKSDEFGISKNPTTDPDMPGLGQMGGRLPVWLEYSGDGFLDFMMMQMAGVAKVLNQIPGGFEEETAHVGLNSHKCLRSQYGQLLDVTGDKMVDIVCTSEKVYPLYIYNYMDNFEVVQPWQNVSGNMALTEELIDTIIADFDNDGLMDVFHLRGLLRPSAVQQSSPTHIEAMLLGKGLASAGDMKGFTFDGETPIDINISWTNFAEGFGQARVYIGSHALTLSTNPGQAADGTYEHYTRLDNIGHDVILHLDPSDEDVQGLPDTTSLNVPSLIIGYDPDNHRWTVKMKATDDEEEGTSWTNAYFQVDSPLLPLTNLTPIGLLSEDGPVTPRLLLNASGSWSDFTEAAGLNIPLSCSSATAGDYDNDMDVDLYLACRTGISNIANLLFENQGNGTFVQVSNAGGAAGPIGTAVADGVGTSDSVVSLDYDGDGYLDLFVTNGLNLYPQVIGGPDKLFRNTGSGNHWVEVKLLGDPTAKVDRDATGAVITATANGKLQTRVQNGGYHRWSQEFGPLHFGLDSATTVDLQVSWPDGTTQTHTGMAADKIYTITQNGDIAAVTPGGGVIYPCGNFTPDSSTPAGVYIRRECNKDDGYPWLVRMWSPTAGQVNYKGTVTSAGDITSLEERNLEHGGDGLDELTQTGPGAVSFNFMTHNQDGFDLKLVDNVKTCMEVTAPADVAIYYGPQNIRVSNSNFNLGTGKSCNVAEEPPPVIPDDDDDDTTGGVPDDPEDPGTGNGGNNGGSDGGGAGAINPYWLMLMLPFVVLRRRWWWIKRG